MAGNNNTSLYRNSRIFGASSSVFLLFAFFALREKINLDSSAPDFSRDYTLWNVLFLCSLFVSLGCFTLSYRARGSGAIDPERTRLVVGLDRLGPPDQASSEAPAPWASR